MSQFSLTEWINNSQENVFAALSDPTLAPQIMHNIKSMEQTTDGEVGVGTRFREVRLVNGKEEESNLEVVAFEAPRRYGVSTAVSGITVTYTYDLSPENGGTQVQMVCLVETKNPLKKLMLPIVSGVMKKEDGAHLQQMKVALETSM